MNAHVPLDVPRRLWLRVEDFLVLSQAGALDGFSKSELIDGEVITINAQFQRHSYAKSQLAFRLTSALAALACELLVLVEVAIAMPPHDMPEPDIVAMRGPLGAGAVNLDAVVLVVEVADTTRDTDLGRKSALYARRNIAEYWVVDLQNAEIVLHWQPGAEGFGQRGVQAFGTTVSAATIAGLTIETSGLA